MQKMRLHVSQRRHTPTKTSHNLKVKTCQNGTNLYLNPKAVFYVLSARNAEMNNYSTATLQTK